MNRRSFNKIVLSGLTSAALETRDPRASKAQEANALQKKGTWPTTVYRRLLVDTHVPDWNPILLSRFDPVHYVSTIAQAGFQALMQYAISCAGLCLWRTKIGTMDRNMKGRDYFGEVMEQCKSHGLHRIAYFHVIWDNHAFDTHPQWRFQPEGGEDAVLRGRYGYTCPNTPYREYALALARELVTNYDFEGIFNDMIIWPGVCYCPYCIERFRKEYNSEPPRVVDWDDPLWRTFQAARERWLLEFAQEFKKTVKSVRPITVEQQFGTVFSNWEAGVSLKLGTEACDYVGGDFYGGMGQFSLVCKAFNGLTQVHPFTFMTSRTSNLTDFVTIKPMAKLKAESFLPDMYSAAMLTIDAINYDGTIDSRVYDILGKINADKALYEPYLGGTMLADVAIYYDKESMYNPEEHGVHVKDLRAVNEIPHFKAVNGAARFLREAHIPFGLITNETLNQLNDYRAVILPYVLEMTNEQAAIFRKFVQQGGVLYASGPSSLDRFDKAGARFLLEDILGVRYKGKLGDLVTYLTPSDKELQKVVWPQSDLIYRGQMVLAEAMPNTEVLAIVTLPFVDPETINVIKSNFAQIISDPPNLTPGTNPGLVMNSHGQGKTVWVAGPIESGNHSVNGKLFVSMLRRVLPRPLYFEVDAHSSVEMTLYHQPESHRLLATLTNMQDELPQIPVGAKVRVQVPSRQRVTRVARVPDRRTIPSRTVGAFVEFDIEPFDALEMAIVEYE